MPSNSSAQAQGATSIAPSQARHLRRGALALRVLKALEQLVLLAARADHAARLDVAEAADLLRDRGDLHRERMVRGREPREQPLDGGLVRADQGALGAALGGVAEDIERGAAHALHRLEQ